MRNYKNKTKFNRGVGKTKPNDQLRYDPQKSAGTPVREYEINPNFQRRAYKDLAFDAITVKVDPAGEVSHQADPYAICNRANPVVDASYPGEDNFAGSVVPQLAQSNQSTFRDMPDSIEQEIKINMYYCKTNSSSNADNINVEDEEDPEVTYNRGTVNLKMDVPYDDIMNTITAEAFYDLNFFKWYPSGTYYSADPQLDVLLNYQSIVQTIANVPLRYRVIRSLEKHLKDMCYFNGSSKMNRLFGMLKKSSFVNLVKSVSEILMTHYLDAYWYNQVSMLVAIPCRKSNSMVDPLIDIIPTYDINTDLVVYADEQHQTPLYKIIDFSRYTDIVTNARNFMLKTSPQYLLSMARNSELTTTDINNWINGLTDSLDAIIANADRFRSDFADLLVAFKRMSKVGITEWKTGFFVNIDKIDDKYEPKFNKLIFDILRASYTGSVDYKYIDRTGQWEVHDLWDKYLGISTYNYKSGGCVLTTSTRHIDRTDAPSSLAVPVLFYGPNGDISAKILTRTGRTYTIVPNKTTLITAGSIAKTMGRLVPITPLDDDYFIFPYVDLTNAASSKDQGWIATLLTSLFGYGETKVGVDEYNRFTSPDALCFVDVEIPDQTNSVMTFVRQHSPFRVVKTTTDMLLGFSTSKN